MLYSIYPIKKEKKRKICYNAWNVKTDGNPYLGWGVGLVVRVCTTLSEDPCQVAYNCL